MENALVPQTYAAEAKEPVWTPDLVKYRRWFDAYETNKQNEIDEQRTFEQYYHSKQWTAEEVRKLKRRGQAPIFDNRISRKIDFLVGIEQRMRRDPKGYPRNPGDEQAADVATACERYVCDVNRWDNVSSQGTHNGMVRGIGAAFVGIKTGRNGPDPVLKTVPADRFFYDPRSMMPDFSDARYMGLHLWIDVDEAIEQFPDKETELLQAVDKTASTLALVKSDQDHSTAWSDFESRRIRLVEFWERTAKGWRYVKFTGDTVLEAAISPYLDEEGMPDCPYVAWSPYIDEQGNRYGPIRAMKPMQDEVNHRRSKFLHLLNAKQIHARKGVLDDEDKFRSELTKPDGLLEHNGTWGEDVGVVDHSADIRGQAELLAQSQSSLENLGPNPGLIGKGGGVAEQSGRAILAQRDSGMTELSPVFERNRDWKLRVYRKIWNRIKQAWQAPKYIRVTDDDNAPAFLGINQYEIDPMTGQIVAQNVLADIDVDIIMEEGPDVITMNEELLQTLSQIGANPAVPAKVLIELSNAPNKDRLFKLIDDASAGDPAIAEMQKRMARLEELLAAAKVDEAVANVESKRADTVTKLANAFTPQAQQTDEFGNPMGPPPAPPGMGLDMGFMAMQAFPLNYGMPTLEQQAMMMPQPGEEQPPDDMMSGQGEPQMMPPQDMGAMMPAPEMLPGGLPVDPGAMGVQ